MADDRTARPEAIVVPAYSQRASRRLSPPPWGQDDVTLTFPAGAPVALYAQQNQSSARALKAVLALDS